eukprot:CAMPEP_0168851614 /NCGR_PEP_ID=MMETSP0727-20121128/12512_1 /TAXON_ID=265536 /ORGANISM="Amphiprora sp., Strain CCMP467" /LENGTH=80 /DNA_ID=CAMNT_0008905631 /DNA_START=25 /DNA_END=264 /DNA_ORIENTATION=-
MGCGASKDVSALNTVDDSMHVMMKKDKKTAKKHGEPTNMGYKPRAEHPLLNGGNNNQDNKDEKGTQEAAPTPVIAHEEWG